MKPDSSQKIKLLNVLCHTCFDTGVVLKNGNLRPCTNALLNIHPAPNAAHEYFFKAIARVEEQGRELLDAPFELAQYLCCFTSEAPCSRVQIETYFSPGNVLTEAQKKREIASLVEYLQQRWQLPVGSRKHEPSGYYINTNLNDFLEWKKRALKPQFTRIKTVNDLGKANYPDYEGQLKLGFEEAA